ncbi:uncharacterized protein LOC124336534 [Daphnia pulicaria]|uniref:uncharacterized protein LOC124336534 n=1 Tax=Daphnia pulicaria TaxID=35523 RepID=UPI001EEB5130|nr:uncharacterized protein LOC124336534 [Daphnia pulicaria]
MDKIAVSLFLLLTLSTIVCNGWPSWRHHRSPEKTTTTHQHPSLFRVIGLYANPFGWIGTPTLPKRTKNNRKSDRVGHQWVIEIDESDHWWVTVYENGAQIPGPGRKAIMKLF